METSIVPQSFFGEASRFLPKRDNSILKSIFCNQGSSENNIKHAKTALKATAIFGLITLVFINYDNMRSIINDPPGSRDYQFSASLLGVQSFLLAAAFCIGLIFYRRFRFEHNQIAQKYPHFSNYQGSLLTTPEYRIRQGETQNERLCTPIIKSCFENLKEKGLLDLWLKVEGHRNLEEAAAALFKGGEEGLCYGHSMALLGMMLDNADASSTELMDKIEFDTVYYYQLMHHIINTLVNKSRTELYEILLEHYPQIDQEIGSLKLTRNTVFLLMQNIDFETILFTELNYINFSMQDESIESTQDKRIESAFNGGLNILAWKEIQRLFSGHIKRSSFTIAGTFHLRESEENEKTEGKHYGHALFFQFSDEHYRFHDSGSGLTGFYEFPNKELFFEKLFAHLQTWPQFKDGRLGMCLLGIPKGKPSSTIFRHFSRGVAPISIQVMKSSPSVEKKVKMY